MSQIQGDNKTHNDNVRIADVTRAAAVAAATTQVQADAATVAFLRTAKASALANGCSPEVFIDGLRALGTGGS
jgi:hypothetical protein